MQTTDDIYRNYKCKCISITLACLLIFWYVFNKALLTWYYTRECPSVFILVNIVT